MFDNDTHTSKKNESEKVYDLLKSGDVPGVIRYVFNSGIDIKNFSGRNVLNSTFKTILPVRIKAESIQNESIKLSVPVFQFFNSLFIPIHDLYNSFDVPGNIKIVFRINNNSEIWRLIRYVSEGNIRITHYLNSFLNIKKGDIIHIYKYKTIPRDEYNKLKAESYNTALKTYSDVIKKSKKEIEKRALSPRQESIINYLGSGGVKSITLKEYMQYVGVSRATAIRDINKLIELDYIYKRKHKRINRYYLKEKKNKKNKDN